MPLSRFEKIMVGIGVASLLAAAVIVWAERWHKLDWRDKPRICDEETARRLGGQLKRLAARERVRAWATPGLPSRQAAWIAVNAEFALDRTKILDAKVEPTAEQRQMIQEWTDRLLRATFLSRHGAQEIPEDGSARLRAYRAHLDCSLQTYSISVPPAYDPDVKWPLIVSMHGHGWFKPYQGHPAPVYKGAFCLSPQGRGATDYRDLGEVDVLSALEDVNRDFSIDPDRIYLKGSSMGGTGAWHLGVHYADRFAGIMPIAGNADNRAWTYRWQWNEPFEERFDDLRLLVQEAHTSRAFAQNLLNLPAYIVHGSGDTVVPPEHARLMVEELQRFKCPFQYREFPNVGHGGFNNALIDEGLAWICGNNRRTHPEHVRWTTAQMRHSTCYWLRVVQMARPLEFASLDARRQSDNRIEIAAENVRAFSIRLDAGLVNPARPVFVTVNDDRVIFPPPGETQQWKTLRFHDSSGWDDDEHQPRPRLMKTHGLDGPIHEAILDPFALVVGTQSHDPEITELWKREARSFAAEWKRRNGAPCPFVADVQVTPELAARRNLICFGGPEHNRVAASLQFSLPLDRILADAAAPDWDYPGFASRVDRLGPDVGYMTVYPNPDAQERLVVIVHGNGPEAIYQAWQRFGNWFNWGVYDSKKYFDYAVYDARSASPETMLLTGYYGTDWNIDTGRQFHGVEALRKQMAPQQFPAYETVPEDAATFDLVNLRPVMIDQMRGAVGFGRTFQGLPLPLGIGVRAPTFLEYELDGTVARLIAGGRILNSPETGMPRHREAGEKVRFIVKGDNTVLASATCSWDSPVAQLEADLTGVKRLRLEAVTAGGPAWLHAGAAWIAPRLYRR